MTSRRRSRSVRALAAAELDLMPLMNLFIAIIPLLLLSAVFVQVSVIKMGATGDPDAAAVANEAPLDVTVRVSAGAYVVEANGRLVQHIERPEASQAARATLQEALAAIAAEHPDHKEVRIVAAPTTQYDEIIAVMDVARAAGLPDAALDDEAS